MLPQGHSRTVPPSSSVPGSGRRTRRTFLSTAAVGSALLLTPGLLTACAGAAGSGTGASRSPDGPPRKGGRITFARIADAITVDPVAATDNESIWVISNLYDRLYRSTEHGSIEPCLASGHHIAHDQLTWTFTLRRGVRFADGSPMTAADVKYSIDRCSRSAQNGYINDAIRSVETPDDHTVVITTKYPTALLGPLSMYANGVVPKDLQGQDRASFFGRPIGTGAFSLTSWLLGRQMVLTRNPHYWRAGLPYLDQVTLVTFPDDSSRILQLRGAGVDIVEAPPWSQLSSLQNDQDIVVELFDSTYINYVMFNQATPALADVHARTAIALATDREAIVKLALFGHGQPAGSFFAPTWPFYDSSLTAAKRDVSAAKRELSMSTTPRGFTVTHSINAGDTVQAATAQVLQSNLREIGIEVKIQQYDANTLLSMVDDGQYEMTHSYLSLDIMDPVENVGYAVDPATGGLAVGSHYRDRQVIAWTDQAGRTTHPATQRAAYQKVQRRIYETDPVLPLYYLPYAYATSARVHGFSVPPTGDYRLENTWVAG